MHCIRNVGETQQVGSSPTAMQVLRFCNVTPSPRELPATERRTQERREQQDAAQRRLLAIQQLRNTRCSREND